MFYWRRRFILQTDGGRLSRFVLQPKLDQIRGIVGMDVSHSEPSGRPSAATDTVSFAVVLFLSVQYHDFFPLTPSPT